MPGRFVIDNSVVMAWCFEDETSSYADTILESLKTTAALAPSVWPLELGNALLAARRRNRLGKAPVTRFLALMKNLPIHVEQESPERMLNEILSLAREQGISTYDASYLDLAMRKGLPIATLDSSLEKAARNCQIPAFDPIAA